MPKSQCKKIATHTRPHLDEIAAIWLLRKFGQKKYQGIKKAPVEFWNEGGVTPDGRSAEDYEKEGYLLIGTGRGKFDEHQKNGSKQENNGDCATTLVVKDLGIEDDPALAKIIKFVVNNDLKGAFHPFDLCTIAKNLNAQFPDQPEKVIEWSIMGLEAKYQEQIQFFESTKKEFQEKAKIEEIPVGKMSLKMVTIESEDELISKFARSSFGCEAAIVIQKRTSGNVQIYTNKKYGLKIIDVAQMLRLEEQKLKHNFITTDWKELAAEGKVDGAEEWYFHYEGQMLLNGSLSAPNVPPTRIPLKKIQKIVTLGVDPNNLPVYCSTRRRCIYKQCDLYQFGLHRCRKMRYEMKTN